MEAKNALLPAFHLLWRAAEKESTKYVNDNASPKTARNSKTSNGVVLKPHNNNEVHVTSHLVLNGNHDNAADSEESVVVCTLECDHGDKFVRQVIHDGTTRSVWSRAEDLFVDWLNSDLTAQHAQVIEVTMYFCRLPVSYSSDGISLWVKNLRDEGKEVNLKIKVASLGHTVVRALELSQPVGKPGSPTPSGKGRIQEIHELNDAKDNIRAIRKLQKMGAQIEPISTGDWVQLISLLTDRASLQSLDLKRTSCSTALATILQSQLIL